MANYADILNVICLYSHSLRGSTVLPTTQWVTWLRHRAFIYFLLTHCVIAQHCSVVTCMTSKSTDKPEILTRCRSETPENFITKIVCSLVNADRTQQW